MRILQGRMREGYPKKTRRNHESSGNLRVGFYTVETPRRPAPAGPHTASQDKCSVYVEVHMPPERAHQITQAARAQLRQFDIEDDSVDFGRAMLWALDRVAALTLP